MPDVTTAPVLIDAATLGFPQQFQGPNFNGPFRVGSNLYVMLRQSPVFPPRNINMFKSTDGGLTWSVKDAANAPTSTQTFSAMTQKARLNPNGTTITVAFNPTTAISPATLSFATFNTLTDTWTKGVIPDLVVNDANHGAGLLAADFIVRNNGDIFLATNIVVAPALTFTDGGYFIMSGGVWSAFTSVATANQGISLSYAIPALVYDSVNGVTHYFIRQTTVALEQDFYLQVNDANVATAPTQLSVRPANQRLNYGSPVLWNGSVCLPVFGIFSGGGTIENVRVYIGTPLNAPVFTLTDFAAGTPTLIGDQELAQLAVDGTDLILLWVNWQSNAISQVMRATNSGAGFGAVATFYDQVLNPTNASPPSITGLSVGKIGSIGAIIATHDPNNVNNAGYFLIGAAPPAPVFGGPVKLKVPEPVSLPDPRILCNFSHPKPCGDELDCRNYVIHATKGVFGTYK